MALFGDTKTGKRNLADQYAIVALTANQWTVFAKPAGIQFCEAQSTNSVVAREANSATLPTDTPVSGLGIGALVPSSFDLDKDTTHLFFYPLGDEDDTLYLNLYSLGV